MIPIEKLEAVARRFSEVENLLCSPAVLTNHQKLQQLNRERSEIEPVIAAFNEWREGDRKIKEDRGALGDPALPALAQEERPVFARKGAVVEGKTKGLAPPPD